MMQCRILISFSIVSKSLNSPIPLKQKCLWVNLNLSLFGCLLKDCGFFSTCPGIPAFSNISELTSIYVKYSWLLCKGPFPQFTFSGIFFHFKPGFTRNYCLLLVKKFHRNVDFKFFFSIKIGILLEGRVQMEVLPHKHNQLISIECFINDNWKRNRWKLNCFVLKLSLRPYGTLEISLNLKLSLWNSLIT